MRRPSDFTPIRRATITAPIAAPIRIWRLWFETHATDWVQSSVV
jgi:hypothetical protein